MSIFAMAVNIQRLRPFAQIHQDPRGVLQAADVGNMIPVIMGQNHSIQLLQINVILQQR